MEAELHSHFPLVHRLTHARTEPILIPRLQLQGLIALAFGFLSSIKAGACNGMIPTTPSTGSQRFTPGTKFQLPANYNKDERPGALGDTTLVEFEIHVQAINPIKAADMDFRMELLVSLTWRDPRLVFPDAYFEDQDRFILPNEFIDLIWHPDPFFANAKSTDVGQLTQKLVNVYIYRNQTLMLSINLFATIACAMQFQYYPYDFQLCPTIIESFSYDESLVKYSWSTVQPFTINHKIRMLQFVVTYPLRVEKCSVHRVKESRIYSQLVAYFRFDRLLGNHLIQNFAPCFLIVSLTWLSFWLELDAVSARVSLLVTSILTLVTQFTGLRAEFPPVAYLKAVDLWMAMCLLFVVAALGEFVIVKVIYSMTQDAKALAEVGKTPQANLNDPLGNLIDPPPVQSRRIPSGFNAQVNQVVSSVDGELDDGPFLKEMDRMNKNEGPKGPGGKGNLVTVGKRKGLASAPKPLAHRLSELSMPELSYYLGGRLRLPLVYTHAKTGMKHVLWRDIDYLCRWAFPTTFCACVSVYWLVLFVHSRLNSPDHKPPSYCD